MSRSRLLELARVGERIEASAYASMIRSAPAALRKKCRASLREIGSGNFFAIPAVPWTTPNRILGLGIVEPAKESDVDEVVAACNELRIPKFCVPVCSCARPSQDEIVRWLVKRGFVPYNTWVKMHRVGGEPPKTEPSQKLKVRKIDKDQAAIYARIAVVSFGYPGNYAEWLRGPVGKEGWHHFMAYLGEEPVATGVLFIDDSVGNLLIGSTLESHRRLGAQTLLFSERLRYGSELGCRTFFTETHMDTPGVPNPSYHNMIRAGFKPVYTRLNYLFGGT